MHPPLFREHPDCEAVVQALVRCHEEHAIGKFFGSCNDAKAALDSCFRAEKDHKRKQNLEKARADQKQFKEYMATIEARKKQETSA